MTPGDAFERLEPPPGGLQALRERLAGEPRRRATRRRWTVVALAAACLALALWRWSTPTSRLVEAASSEHYLALVSLGLVDPPREPVTALPSERDRPPVPLRRVPLATSAVVMYMPARPPR